MQVAEFIMDCIERAGGLAEQREPDAIDAIIPGALHPTGVEREVTLALVPEVLEREPRAEPASLGSPFLDSLIARAVAHGTASVGQIMPERLKRKGLRDEVERVLVFSNCRVRYEDAEPEVLRSHIVQFNFKVSFLADDRRERLYVVPVNLWSNQVNLPMVEHLSAASRPVQPMSLRDAPRIPISDAYATAQNALRGLVAEEIGRHQERIRKRFSVECLRIQDYYDQVASELERRRHAAADEGRTGALDAKLEAARTESRRKLHELGEKYRLRVCARLTSGRLVSQPKTFFRLFIDRGATTRTLTLAYDSWLGRLEPPICEACHTEMTRVHVSQQARLLCPGCSGD